MSVTFVLAPVDLKKRNRALPVDFVAGRIPKIALGDVSLQALSTLAVLETKLADVNALERAQLRRVGREVPRLDAMFSQLDELDVLHPCHDVVVVGHHAARLPRRLLERLLGVIVERRRSQRGRRGCKRSQRSGGGDRRGFPFPVDLLLKRSGEHRVPIHLNVRRVVVNRAGGARRRNQPFGCRHAGGVLPGCESILAWKLNFPSIQIFLRHPLV